MRIRLTGLESEIALGLVRLRQAFDDLTDITDPYPSDEQPDVLCVDLEVSF
ncbi:hypothetical protein [Streptacidiphilus sp. PAMC 29251]